MNEHDNLTPTEMESYRSALKESYPAPKTDIHAAVMKQIRAERILMKKRERRKIFVKWGSVAACLLLVGMIALKVVPEADKLMAPMAENNSGKAEDFAVASYSMRDEDEADAAYSVDENNVTIENDNRATEDYAPEAAEPGKDNAYSEYLAALYGTTSGDTKANGEKIDGEKPDGMDLLNNGGKDSTEAETPTLEAPETEAVATENPVTLAPETEEETEETEEEPETESAEETK